MELEFNPNRVSALKEVTSAESAPIKICITTTNEPTLILVLPDAQRNKNLSSRTQLLILLSKHPLNLLLSLIYGQEFNLTALPKMVSQITQERLT